MVMTPLELARFLAKIDLKMDGYLNYRPNTPIEVMKQLESEGFCKLYTYSWKTGPGVAETRWYALVEEK